MGDVAIVYKITPVDIEVDLKALIPPTRVRSSLRTGRN